MSRNRHAFPNSSQPIQKNSSSATQFQNKILTHENQTLHIQNILSHETLHFTEAQCREMMHKYKQENDELRAMHRDAELRIRILEEERYVMRTKMDHLMERNDVWIKQNGGMQRNSTHVTNNTKRTSTGSTSRRESLRSETHSRQHSELPLDQPQRKNLSSEQIDILNASVAHRQQLQRENQALHAQIQILQDKILLRDEEIMNLAKQCVEPSAQQLNESQKEMEHQRAVGQLVEHVHYLQEQLEQLHGELSSYREREHRCTCRYEHAMM